MTANYSSILGDYLPIEAIHKDFKLLTCYVCGDERWFKRSDWSGDDGWNCRSCGNRHSLDIEIPCWECNSPLRKIRKGVTCVVCGYENQLDRDDIINRLSDDHAYAIRGKPGVLMGDCPFCESDSSINGGPDGELICGGPRISEFVTTPVCFYAGQYSDQWFAYGQWLLRKDRVNINYTRDSR